MQELHLGRVYPVDEFEFKDILKMPVFSEFRDDMRYLRQSPGGERVAQGLARFAGCVLEA